MRCLCHLWDQQVWQRQGKAITLLSADMRVIGETFLDKNLAVSISRHFLKKRNQLYWSLTDNKLPIIKVYNLLNFSTFYTSKIIAVIKIYLSKKFMLLSNLTLMIIPDTPSCPQTWPKIRLKLNHTMFSFVWPLSLSIITLRFISALAHIQSSFCFNDA